MLEEFVQLQGFHQLVDFPTHEDGNTLDLIMSDFGGTAKAAAHLGNSDHVSIAFELQMGQEVAVDAAPLTTRNWRKAPWTHIRGEVKRRSAALRVGLHRTANQSVKLRQSLMTFCGRLWTST